MAIAKVWAMINSAMYVLSDNGDGTWSMNATSDSPDGSYVCEFFAEDDAGNIGYRTAILWLYDGKMTCIEWLDDKYHVKYLNSEKLYALDILPYDYSCRHTMRYEYSCRITPYKYSCRYVKRRCPAND